MLAGEDVIGRLEVHPRGRKVIDRDGRDVAHVALTYATGQQGPRRLHVVDIVDDADPRLRAVALALAIRWDVYRSPT